jgi:hypothetical protein
MMDWYLVSQKVNVESCLQIKPELFCLHFRTWKIETLGGEMELSI